MDGNYDKRPNEFLSFLHILFIMYIDITTIAADTWQKLCWKREGITKEKSDNLFYHFVVCDGLSVVSGLHTPDIAV